MKPVSQVIQQSIEKGIPLSSFAIERLRTNNQDGILKANAHNIVLAMIEGKPIRQCDYEEAVTFFPEQANEWLASGGKVKEEKSLSEWTSIYAIAKELNVSEQSIHQMMKRNITVAPRPNSQGKYNRNEVKEFVANRAYNTSRGSKDYKQKILEQEFRLKKCKADEAEGLVIARATVIDILNDADITLESVLKAVIKDCTTDERKQEQQIKKAKIHFKRWREFIASLA